MKPAAACLFMVSCLLALPSAVAYAQDLDTPPSWAPTGAMMCRSIAGAAGDSVASMRIIEDAGGKGYGVRQLRAYYDSLGSPLALMIFAMDTATLDRTDGIVARFAPEAAGTYSSMKTDSATLAQLKQASDTNAATDLRSRPMTPSEVAQARETAVWIWKHGCGHP